MHIIMKGTGHTVEELIRLEAYLLSEKAGHPHGMQHAFWEQAKGIVHGRVEAAEEPKNAPKKSVKAKAPAKPKASAKKEAAPVVAAAKAPAAKKAPGPAAKAEKQLPLAPEVLDPVKPAARKPVAAAPASKAKEAKPAAKTAKAPAKPVSKGK